MDNADYAFYQLAYYDVPKNDSLRIFSSFPNYDVPFRLFVSYECATLVDETEFERNVFVNLKNVTSCFEMGEAINQTLAQMSTVTHHNYEALKTASSSIEVYKSIPFGCLFNWARRFYYDRFADKFVIEFNSVSYEDWHHPNQPDGGPASVITGIKLRFGQASDFMGVNPIQNLLLGTLMGCDEPRDIYAGTWSSTYLGNSARVEWPNGLSVSIYPTTWYPLINSNDTNVSEYVTAGVKIFCSSHPRMYSGDGYVYIRGGSETSMWNTDGTSSDIIEFFPRNRESGKMVLINDAMVGSQTNKVKTSLMNLRALKLRITDSNNLLLSVDQQMVFKIVVSFNIDD